MPAHFYEPYVVAQDVNCHQARLWVADGERHADAFAAQHHVDIERHPVNLEQLFPILVKRRGESEGDRA